MKTDDFKSQVIYAQASLKYFSRKFLGLQWPGHYTEWQKIVDDNSRSLIQSARGSWKTFFFSLAYPLWRVLRARTEVLLVSDSEDQSRKNLRVIREKVESNDYLKFMWPTTRELWGTDQIQFSNGSLIAIMGFGTSKRGTHPDLIINDDIEGENNKMSREDKNRIYFAVISGMALPHTKLVTVGTPMEFGDILEQLEKNDLYRSWKRPALKDGVNQFPDIWTDDWLEFRRKEMGSLNFAREMLLERIDPQTQVFKSQYETLYEEAPQRFAFKTTWCDPAYSENDGDYTAIVTVGHTHGNHGYVLEAKRVRREDPGMIVDEIFKTIKAYEPDSFGIGRRKGDAISYSFQERRIRENLWNFRYVEIPETMSKRSNERIGGLVPRWESRSIHVHKNMKEFLEELYAFRFDDSHAHDDMIDSLSRCFHPDMCKPNFGKQFMPLPEQKLRDHSFYRLGRNHVQGTVDEILGRTASAA